jgi:hypothetical protein
MEVSVSDGEVTLAGWSYSRATSTPAANLGSAATTPGIEGGGSEGDEPTAAVQPSPARGFDEPCAPGHRGAVVVLVLLLSC